MTSGDGNSSPTDHSGDNLFAARPTIAPEAFYGPNEVVPSSPQSRSASQSPRAEASPRDMLSGELAPDIYMHLQENGDPADAVVEAEKAKMAKLLEEMAESVSHVAQRDLFHTLQRGDRDGQESDELSVEELGNIARVGHVQLTDAELAEVMNQMDVNENGRVSLTEFRSWWSGGSEIATRLKSALENSKLGGTEYLSQVDSSLHWTKDRYSSAIGPGSAVPLPKSAQFASAIAPRSSSETITTALHSDLSPTSAAGESGVEAADESFGSGGEASPLEQQQQQQSAASPSDRSSVSPAASLSREEEESLEGGTEEEQSLQLPVGQRQMGPSAEWARGPPAPALSGASVGLLTVAPRQLPSPSAAAARATAAAEGQAPLSSLGLSSFTSLALSPVPDARDASTVGAGGGMQLRSDSAASDDSLAGGGLFSGGGGAASGRAAAPPRSPTVEPTTSRTTSGRPSKLSAVLATLSSTVERERQVIQQRTASQSQAAAAGAGGGPSHTNSADWRAKHGERMEEFRLGSVARDGTLSSRLA
jgi:hypothetical protein